jgi:hypothetical protein
MRTKEIPMLLTLMLDYPNIICLEKPDLKTLAQDLEKNTEMSEEMIIDMFMDSVGIIMILDSSIKDKKDGWDEAFRMLAPREVDINGKLEPTGETDLSEQHKKDLRLGGANLLSESQSLYPERYEKTEKAVKTTLTFVESLGQLDEDPLLAQLLNSQPKGSA